MKYFIIAGHSGLSGIFFLIKNRFPTRFACGNDKFFNIYK